MTNQDIHEDSVLLWQLANEMAKGSSDTREECWLELMRAFWSGDFAPNGLVLWQTDYRKKDGDKSEVLTRFDLALAALGSGQYKTLGAKKACRELMDWNVESYAKLVGFRYVGSGTYDRHNEPGYHYYFSTAEPQRGLSVDRSEFEKWREKSEKALKSTAAPIDKISNGAPSRTAPDLSNAMDAINALGPMTNLRLPKKVEAIQEWCRKKGLKAPGQRTVQKAFSYLKVISSQNTVST
jgi:hypothetical protein